MWRLTGRAAEQDGVAVALKIYICKNSLEFQAGNADQMKRGISWFFSYIHSG